MLQSEVRCIDIAKDSWFKVKDSNRFSVMCIILNTIIIVMITVVVLALQSISIQRQERLGARTLDIMANNFANEHNVVSNTAIRNMRMA